MKTQTTVPARPASENGLLTSGPSPAVIAARSLEGDRVISSDGEDVGLIREIMVNLRDGRVAYVVISSGGFLGIGNKLLAVHWHALHFDADQQCFRTAASAEEMRHAPGFDKHAWPANADRMWATSLHQYYGREPHWPDDVEPSLRFNDTGMRGMQEPPAAGVATAVSDQAQRAGLLR